MKIYWKTNNFDKCRKLARWVKYEGSGYCNPYEYKNLLLITWS